MPVPLYLSGVVIIFAFLDLGKNISFSDSLHVSRQMFYFSLEVAQHLNKYGHSDCFPLLQRGIEGDFLIQPGIIENLRSGQQKIKHGLT